MYSEDKQDENYASVTLSSSSTTTNNNDRQTEDRNENEDSGGDSGDSGNFSNSAQVKAITLSQNENTEQDRTIGKEISQPCRSNGISRFSSP